MAPKVTHANEMAVNRLRYSKVMNPKQGKNVYVNYEHLDPNTGKSSVEPLLLRMPIMFTWGAGLKKKENPADRDKYGMSLQFPKDDDEYTPELRAFLDKLHELEDQIINDCAANSLAWYGKQRSVESVRESFGHPKSGGVLKYPMDKKTQIADTTKVPHVDVKLSIFEERFQFSIFDEERNLLYSPNNATVDPLELIPKFAKVQAMVQVSIWFQGMTTYPVFTLKQAIVSKSASTSVNYDQCIFDELTTTEKQTLYAKSSLSDDADAPRMNSQAPSTSHIGGLQVDDTDDEEEDEVVIPVVQPKKKSAVEAAPPVVVKPTPQPVILPDDDEDEEPIVPVPSKVKKTKTKSAK